MNQKEMKNEILKLREKRAENNLAMVEIDIEINERKSRLNEMVVNRYNELKRDYFKKVADLKVASVQEIRKMASKNKIELGESAEELKLKIRHKLLDNIEKDLLDFKKTKEKDLGIDALSKKKNDRMQVSSNLTGRIIDLNKNDLEL